jgi:hypothetical protein
VEPTLVRAELPVVVGGLAWAGDEVVAVGEDS